jgi:hypothetical protein
MTAGRTHLEEYQDFIEKKREEQKYNDSLEESLDDGDSIGHNDPTDPQDWMMENEW